VVVGLGAVGLCALRSALFLGAAKVFAVDPVAARRDRAAALGAIAIPAPAMQAVMDATGGIGADSVIDAVGNDTSLDDSLATVRAGGTVSVVGVHNLNPYPFPALTALLRSLTVRLTTAPVQQTWPELIPLLQNGRLDVEGIFTTRLSLEQAADGYAAVASRSGEHVKVLLTP